MRASSTSYDAVIVGAGPNGLASAITLARAGWSTLLIEGHETIGGGTRTETLTLPGFLHDVCSTSHPTGIASPFLRGLPLARYGLEWVQPDLALAHPLPDGHIATLSHSLKATALSLGADGAAYRRLIQPLVQQWAMLAPHLLGPLDPLAIAREPRTALGMARFGAVGLQPASWAARRFRTAQARGLFAGLAAHGMVPLDQPPTAAFGMILAALAHVDGWPFARGGSRAITDAMAAYLRDLGGEIITGVTVKSLRDLPPARATLLDVTPRQLLAIADEKLPQHYRQALSHYRYGMGTCKVDYALSGPVPWADKLCARAGVVHLGGAWEAIALAERATWEGRMAEQPLVLVAQPSRWDPTRAPAGKHVLWAYCHTPHASPADVSEAIERQIERFAPGFRGRILARHVMTAQDLEAYNPNYVGGAINGGAQTLDQLFTRPTLRANPYTTPVPGLFLCSSATPPGGGVHGMCGYHAAMAALRG